MDLFKKKYTIIELCQWRHFVSACRVRQVNPSISTAGQWESLWDGKIQNAKVEDGSEVGGNRADFPLCTGGTPSRSSEEQSDQSMDSQLI